jgi:hypothetical protein
MTTEKERRWEEDFPHENGNYMNICIDCKEIFFGHKRRVLCKCCSHDKWEYQGKTPSQVGCLPVIALFIVIFLFCSCVPAIAQHTPKEIVLHNLPFRIDTMPDQIVYRYKMFRVIINSKDSVIVKAGNKGRSLYVSPADKKITLERLRKL